MFKKIFCQFFFSFSFSSAEFSSPEFSLSESEFSVSGFSLSESEEISISSIIYLGIFFFFNNRFTLF